MRGGNPTGDPNGDPTGDSKGDPKALVVMPDATLRPDRSQSHSRVQLLKTNFWVACVWNAAAILEGEGLQEVGRDAAAHAVLGRPEEVSATKEVTCR